MSQKLTQNDHQEGPRIAKNTKKNDFGKPEKSKNGPKKKLFEGTIFGCFSGMQKSRSRQPRVSARGLMLGVRALPEA